MADIVSTATSAVPVKRSLRDATVGDMSTNDYACVIARLPEDIGQELQRTHPDVVSLSGPLHLTLLPPVRCTRAKLPELLSFVAATAAEQSPFAITIAGAATFWPTSPVLYLSVTRDPALRTLHQALCQGPLGCDFRFPFVPHITVGQVSDDAAAAAGVRALSGFSAVVELTQLDVIVGALPDDWMTVASYSLAE